MGFILLVIAIILYFKGERVYSTVLFFSFLLSGFRILPDVFLGAKLTQMAFGYVLIIFIVNLISKWEIRKHRLARPLWFFIIFVTISCFYSIFYYNFPALDVIVTSLRYWVILSFFILIKLTIPEVKKILRILLIITVVTSLLYSVQVISGVRLLSYSYEVFEFRDPTTGLFVFYNLPPLAILFLLTTLFKPDIFHSAKLLIVSRIVLFSAVILTMGRTSIAGIAITILLGFLIGKTRNNNLRKIIIIIIFISPFLSLLIGRFEFSKIKNDFQLISSGNYSQIEGNGGNSEATMAYRVAWIYERWDYLTNRPISEIFMGLGMLTDDNPVVIKKYKFYFGLYDKEKGYTAQIRTPDISWGNYLTTLGLFGTFIWLYLWFAVAKFYYKQKTNSYALVCFLLFIYVLITSISGSFMSEPYNIVIFFLFIPLVKKTNNKNILYKNDE